MALGGQGAPLVPYVDYLLFRSQTKNRLLLNLGGIANFTVLPKQCRPEDVIAFDTGPANMVIDSLMRKFFKKEFDRNGAIAKRGKINELLLQWMLTHRYFKRKPPKSTGREMFGKFFVKDIMSRAKKLSPFEIIATATEFTPKSVYLQYEKFVHPICEIDELFVSGGGAKNTMIMNSLEKYFSFAEVKPFESVGFSSEAKEAVAFAILANETISGNPSNLPSVTGARKQTILGSIAIP
jgi:anhydro-N-acetylmuramic acid kinase